MVHEWGHLRWGLFDEYPYEYEESFYFSPSTETIEATRCSTNIQGVYLNQFTGGSCGLNPDNGLYDALCTFYPTNQESTEISSFMGHNYLDAVSK